VTSTSSDWVRRDVEVGKHVDEDDEDDVSECSVLVNVSSPRLEERHDAPSKFSMADNRTEYSLQHMNSTQKAKSYQEEGFGEYDYYPEDDEDEYEDVELDGECNELCDAISQFTMKENDGAGGLPVSTGQHIRFSYNSDDEIEALVVDAEPPHQQGKLLLDCSNIIFSSSFTHKKQKNALYLFNLFLTCLAGFQFLSNNYQNPCSHIFKFTDIVSPLS
jgi:hypothetical protein